MWQVEVSHKSEMAGPFNRGDTIINKHFTSLYFYIQASGLNRGYLRFFLFPSQNICCGYSKESYKGDSIKC